VIEGRITPKAMTMKYVKRKKGVIYMVFNTGAALLDAIVLAVVSHETEGTYGYKITQEVRLVIEISESTLYPVLRRLQKDECLQIYDMECAGRNRRYYRITEKGRAQLNLYISEWYRYSAKLNSIFEGGLKIEK
jgi:PadR family transcriptional regulator PadR